MTSRRWGTLVSGLVFSLTLATAGSARAQYGFQGIPGNIAVGPFDPAYGAAVAYGATPFNYGLNGCAGCGGYGVFEAFPSGGYGFAGGRRPQTTTSYQSVSDASPRCRAGAARRHRVRRRR